ncbi:hypothetical protein ACEPAF_2128 [Sanghuangporus sanghuang]|uniref:Uncharacterized protein n=1 Tax=Sanghuangporus baumii TaxID=108892 RepID=A0A9Q5HXH3_SANBA|nr:hypothetical protein A7U60_g5147 [Sanghuangporus baumii]
MFNAKLFSRTIVIALIALASATHVSAVCGRGNEIGFGTTRNGGSVIVKNDCGVIDSKRGGICGAYEHGSHANCDHKEAVVSAQTPDGRHWDHCIRTAEQCGSTEVHFCCSLV